MSDLLTFARDRRSDLARQIDERITAKHCHSVVNQYAKPRMLSELYGVAGATLTFEDRLWIASQQICLGVNLLNPHLALYTLASIGATLGAGIEQVVGWRVLQGAALAVPVVCARATAGANANRSGALLLSIS